MEVASSACCEITEGGAKIISSQFECITRQPKANGALMTKDEALLPSSEKSEGSDISDDLMTGSSSTTGVAPLLPSQHTVNSALSQVPVCVPPIPQSSSLSTHRGNFCQHHHHHPQTYNQKQVSSTQSPTSLKADAVHIKELAGDDCCFHCLLACLYCQLLSMCSALGECLVCGIGGANCCDAVTGCCYCCLEAAGDTACTEEACQAVLDCGILGECCCPSDCLEICLECCSICFPA